jgi:hypothetical protein
MQESKSVRIRKDTERKLKRFIKASKKKVFKLHFASDAIEDKIISESQEKQTNESR